MCPIAKTILLGQIAVGLLASFAAAEAVPTRLDGTPDHWQLIRAGKPYFIKGAGGTASPELLKQLGGNSIRTWGADDLAAQLDEAERLGLSVTVGIWLNHENDKFNYNNADNVADLYERARTAILKYKDHPAVLMWGVGNEMEGESGDNAAVWAAVEHIAAMAKQLDPNHPTMTVIAELGGNKVKNIHRLCPAIDVVGINSYGGAPSVPHRYAAAGGTKPFVLTEYGPIGPWEGGHTFYKAPIEPNSSEKAAMYDSAYAKGISAAPGACLGGYAFLWGHKQETTKTWFGMILPDGSITAAAAVVSQHWTGHPLAAMPPEISAIKLAEGDERRPGEITHASVIVKSGTQPARLTWELHAESVIRGEGGSYEPATEQFSDAVAGQGNSDVTVTLPKKSGIYRLYVAARNADHGAATANVPILVAAAPEEHAAPGDEAAHDTAAAGPKTAGLKRPVVLYADNIAASGYVPSGWMGNTKAIALNPASNIDPHSGATCMECQYVAADQFGGVVWQSPANNWGDQAGGRDLTGANRLHFWARGAKGGEKVEFKFGVIREQQKFKDSASGEIAVTLTEKWKEYQIDLAGKDLSQILTGFCWVTAGRPEATTFYLDDIAFE